MNKVNGHQESDSQLNRKDLESDSQQKRKGYNIGAYEHSAITMKKIQGKGIHLK